MNRVELETVNEEELTYVNRQKLIQYTIRCPQLHQGDFSKRSVEQS